MAAPITGVPQNHVGTIVQSFINNGSPVVTAQLEPDGNSTYTVSPASGGPEAFNAAIHLPKPPGRGGKRN
jgi:hypothetical protein